MFSIFRMKTHSQILIVVLALVFASMGAHFGALPETAEQSPDSEHHPAMVQPSIQHLKSMRGHFKLENLPKKLRAKLGAKIFKNLLTKE